MNGSCNASENSAYCEIDVLFVRWVRGVEGGANSVACHVFCVSNACVFSCYCYNRHIENYAMLVLGNIFPRQLVRCVEGLQPCVLHDVFREQDVPHCAWQYEWRGRDEAGNRIEVCYENNHTNMCFREESQRSHLNRLPVHRTIYQKCTCSWGQVPLAIVVTCFP